MKRRMTEGPNKGSTSPGSPAEKKQRNGSGDGAAAGDGDAMAVDGAPEAAAANGGPAAAAGEQQKSPAAAAATAAAAPAGKAATTTTAGGSSENGKSGLGGSHDTEKLVDAMMSDGVWHPAGGRPLTMPG
jgi:hypothetical protein